MIAWILDRAKERSTWMGLFSLASAVGLAFTPEHKELVITADLIWPDRAACEVVRNAQLTC